MSLSEILRNVITPALALLPPKMRDDRAAVMLLAIGLQESRFTTRVQVSGPARGYWQFERGGGVRGVLQHHASELPAGMVCYTRGVAPNAHAVYAQLEHDDVLAAALARLLLFTDPKPLPAIGNVDEAWALYARVWRPGKPHPETWPALYQQACACVAESHTA
jgi:hypothetical protein